MPDSPVSDAMALRRRRRLGIALVVCAALSVVVVTQGSVSGGSHRGTIPPSRPPDVNGAGVHSRLVKNSSDLLSSPTALADKVDGHITLKEPAPVSPPPRVAACGLIESDLAAASLCAAAAESSIVTPRLATDSLGFNVTRCREVARFWSELSLGVRRDAVAPIRRAADDATGPTRSLFSLLREGAMETEAGRTALSGYEETTVGCGRVLSGGVLFSAQGGLRAAAPSQLNGDPKAAMRPPQQLPACPIDASKPKRRDLHDQSVSDLKAWDATACAATNSKRAAPETPLCGGSRVAFASELYRPHHALHFLWSYVGILAAQVAAGGRLLSDRPPRAICAESLPLPDAAFLSVMPYGTINGYGDFNAVTSPHLELLDVLAPRVYIYRDAAYARYVLRPPSWWLNDTVAVQAAIAANAGPRDAPSTRDTPVCVSHVVFGVVPVRIPGIRKRYHTNVGADVWAELRYRVAMRWKLPTAPPAAAALDSPLRLLAASASTPVTQQPRAAAARGSIRITQAAWDDLFLRPILVVRRDARFGRLLLNDRLVARLVQLELTQLLLTRAIAEAATVTDVDSLIEVQLAPGIELETSAGSDLEGNRALDAPLRSMEPSFLKETGGTSESSRTDSDVWFDTPGLIPVRFVRWEGRPLREQMAISLHARAMIGVHGNGLAWTCLMPGPVPIAPPRHQRTPMSTWVFEFSSDIRQRNEVTPGVNTTNAANIVAPSCGLYSLSLWCPYEETERSRAGSPHRRWKNVDVRVEEQQLQKVQRFIRGGGVLAV